MLIECLIEREGFTVVNVQRSKYEFRRNDEGRQVCDVLSQSHLDYLLKLPDFTAYQEKAEPVVIVEEPPPVVESKPPAEEPKLPAVLEKAKKQTTFICENCGRTFTHKLALSGHQRGCLKR